MIANHMATIHRPYRYTSNQNTHFAFSEKYTQQSCAELCWAELSRTEPNRTKRKAFHMYALVRVKVGTLCSLARSLIHSNPIQFTAVYVRLCVRRCICVCLNIGPCIRMERYKSQIHIAGRVSHTLELLVFVSFCYWFQTNKFPI